MICRAVAAAVLAMTACGRAARILAGRGSEGGMARETGGTAGVGETAATVPAESGHLRAEATAGQRGARLATGTAGDDIALEALVGLAGALCLPAMCHRLISTGSDGK